MVSSKLTSPDISRREFTAGATGLVIGLVLPVKARAQSGAAAVIQGDEKADTIFEPNAFIRIAPDNTITVLIKHIEFGQGPYTGLATLVAEEMDADWDQMRAISAPSDAKLYANLNFGIQGTGGSTAMANSFTQMRKAGAAARAMLVEAAAKKWGVKIEEISVAKGRVQHKSSGKSSTFGALAEAARNSTIPADPILKKPENFVFIGKDVPKLDSGIKSTGKADFTIDVFNEDMLTVVVRHPAKFGATVKKFDDKAALKVNGVRRTAEISTGVAVYADSTYSALKGREELVIEWDESEAEKRSSAQLIEAWHKAARGPVKSVEVRGDVKAGLSKADVIHESEFLFPFVAHAPMEPLDAVIEYKDDMAELKMGSQLQTADHLTLANTLKMKPEQIKIKTMLAGGSFGRRGQPSAHIAAEIGEIAKNAGPGSYKLIWTREDDIEGGYYRPMVLHRMRGGLDSDGNIIAWENIVATQSILKGTPFAGMINNGVDPTSIEGSRGLPYDLPNLKVSLAETQSSVPVLWWRSVGHSHTAYATEVFLDELLEKAGKDPVAGRLDLLGLEREREQVVLEEVARIADWKGSKVGNGRARGVALHKSFGSYVSMIAEVSEQDGLPKVHKVWCAIDCGIAVNPDIIRAQMEGGIGYALGTILFSEITLEEGGSVAENNFDTFRVLRMNEMPEVEVAIIKSSADPTGVGEPGVPPLGPAVANAWRALTGKSVKRLPFTSDQT